MSNDEIKIQTINAAKLDWKFILVLAIHLIAVGAMYGRITLQVDNTQTSITEVKKSLDEVKSKVDDGVDQVHNLTLSRKFDAEAAADLKSRISKIEDSLWRPAHKGE